MCWGIPRRSSQHSACAKCSVKLRCFHCAAKGETIRIGYLVCEAELSVTQHRVEPPLPGVILVDSLTLTTELGKSILIWKVALDSSEVYEVFLPPGSLTTFCS